MKTYHILMISFLLLFTGCKTVVTLDSSADNRDYSDISFLITELRDKPTRALL